VEFCQDYNVSSRYCTGLTLHQSLIIDYLVSVVASKWLLRQNAIKALCSFIDSGDVEKSTSDVDKISASILTVVKEHTRGFKETNVNITKAILQLFLSLVLYHESKETPMCSWAMQDGVDLALQKVSDRKLTNACKELLMELCVVCAPSSVLTAVASGINGIKSPVAHEEVLHWFQSFCEDFGAFVIGPGISTLLPWIIQVSAAFIKRRNLYEMPSPSPFFQNRRLNRLMRK